MVNRGKNETSGDKQKVIKKREDNEGNERNGVSGRKRRKEDEGTEQGVETS